SNGIGKRDVAVHLENLEHVAANAGPEAVEEALLRVDVKRRGFFRMKGAESFVRVADPFQRHVLLHDLDDVRLEAQIVDELLREQTHQSLSSTTVTPPPP